LQNSSVCLQLQAIFCRMQNSHVQYEKIFCKPSIKKQRHFMTVKLPNKRF
jgi:hypothetical protein